MIVNGLKTNLITKEIRKLMIEEEKGIKEMGELLGCTHQNVSSKISNLNIKVNDLDKILDVLGYDLEVNFKKRGS